VLYEVVKGEALVVEKGLRVKKLITMNLSQMF
jgi:hypothetical protein